MHTTDVLGQVLFPSEAGTGAPFTIGEGAEERLLGATVHLVNFTFMAQQSATVGKALKLFAAFDVALVWPIVLVHVFTI